MGESFYTTTPWHKIHNHKDKLDVMKWEIALNSMITLRLNSHLTSHSSHKFVIQNDIDGTSFTLTKIFMHILPLTNIQFSKVSQISKS